MSRIGWVKLSRAVLDDPLLNKDPEYLALWIHLLCNAAFEPTPALLGANRVILQPGQLTTGRKQLALNSGISESKVERVLKAFESAQLIEQQTTTRNRLISILSWDDYCESRQPNEQQSNNDRTTIEQRTNTLEEDKKLRNKEKRKFGADKPPVPARKKYGQYGWVKLTDEEYNRLLNDLGQAEVERCIAYIDESAQSNGNKNKWRDWNLVVRRCHRDGWGLGKAAGKSDARVKTAADYADGDDFVSGWNLPGVTAL